MLTINIPSDHKEEIQWVLSVIFDYILGIQYNLKISNSNEITIFSDGKTISINNVFFQKSNDNWLKKASLPTEPLKSFDINKLPFELDLVDKNLPIIYGDPNIKIDEKKNRYSYRHYWFSFFYALKI